MLCCKKSNNPNHSHMLAEAPVYRTSIVPSSVSAGQSFLTTSASAGRPYSSLSILGHGGKAVTIIGKTQLDMNGFSWMLNIHGP